MKNTNPCRSIRILVLGFLFAGLIFEARAQSKPDSGWPTYGNDPGGTRYSPASQINRANGGQATPMTYTLKGKQYLVIAAGGHGKLGSKQGDYVIAFTLP